MSGNVLVELARTLREERERKRKREREREKKGEREKVGRSPSDTQLAPGSTRSRGTFSYLNLVSSC